MQDRSLYIRKNVGPTDQIIRIILGGALIIIPPLFQWPPWGIAVLAALGGSTILEGIIAY